MIEFNRNVTERCIIIRVLLKSYLLWCICTKLFYQSWTNTCWKQTYKTHSLITLKIIIIIRFYAYLIIKYPIGSSIRLLLCSSYGNYKKWTKKQYVAQKRKKGYWLNLGPFPTKVKFYSESFEIILGVN